MDTNYQGGETDEKEDIGWEESRNKRNKQSNDSDDWEPNEEAIQDAEREQEADPGIVEQDRHPEDDTHRPQRQTKSPDWYGTWTE